MQLQDLYANFGEASPSLQVQLVSTYRAKRAEDMAKPCTWPKPKKVTKPRSEKLRAAPLSKEEKVLQKLMGLTKKQIVDLRSAV